MSRLAYPPGPKPLPLVGNLFDIPKEDVSATYAAWGKKYGPVVHLSALGDHFVILNSLRAVVDLFEKRSYKYSDKPVVPILDMMDWLWTFSLMPYGECWRLHRREFHQYFRAKKNKDYHPIIMKGALEFMRNILATPDKYVAHSRRFAGVVILSIVYDYDAAPRNDRFLDIAEEAVDMLNQSAFPGAAIVNFVPFLRYLPAWLPGMQFKRFARRSGELTKEMRDAPIEFVRARMASGVPTRSVAASLIDRYSATPGRSGSFDPEEIIKNVAAMGYSAGAETTVSAISTSLLAMILYPETKEKAQMEIDRVIGSSRLPEFGDRPALPYVEAFVREVLRWHPVLPLGTPHCVNDDDVYEGHFIPKGAIILMNIWALHRDETVYGAEPEIFKPERFLEPDGTIKSMYPITAFGVGRRICAGRHTADSSLWAVTVLLLALFNVTKAKDGAGKEIEVLECYTDGLASHPRPFTFTITARTEQAETLMQETNDNSKL